MKDTTTVDIEESIEQLLHDGLDCWKGEFDLPTTKKASEIMFTELRDDEDAHTFTTVWSSYRVYAGRGEKRVNERERSVT